MLNLQDESTRVGHSHLSRTDNILKMDSSPLNVTMMQPRTNVVIKVSMGKSVAIFASIARQANGSLSLWLDDVLFVRSCIFKLFRLMKFSEIYEQRNFRRI